MTTPTCPACLQPMPLVNRPQPAMPINGYTDADFANGTGPKGGALRGEDRR